jgi:putative DNA primase/helicase
VRASEITPRAVHWLWFPYVPLGKITAVAGQMGQAKSLWTAWLAATTSQGRNINIDRPSGVVMLNAEDDAQDTIRPRLEAVGADLDRVWIEPNVTLDVDHLSNVCDGLGDVRLITIDPVQAYLPSNVNSWKGQDVRLALEPLRTFAAERRLAVVLVQHLNRRTDAGGDPLARIADSQGIPQLARSVLVWGADPSDPEGDHGTQKVLTRAKGNLARSKASATYTIGERVIGPALTAPFLQRGDDREITADDVVADHETRTVMRKPWSGYVAT